MTRIRPATTAADWETARTLFREYAAELGVSLCFQGFEEELATLPGRYAEPRGCLLLAEPAAGEVVGCGALRPLADGVCEMKRLYVRPAARESGLGRQIATALLEAARARGYRTMRLDTLDHMTPANGLYRALGFREISAYYDNPLPGVVYYELAL